MLGVGPEVPEVPSTSSPTAMGRIVHKGHAQGEHEYDEEQQGGTNPGSSTEVLCLGGVAAGRLPPRRFCVGL